MANLNLDRLGFRTRREQLRDQTKRAVGQIMHAIVADRILHAEVIAGGIRQWRTRFLRETSGLAVNQDVADKLWVFFCEAWKQTPEAGMTAGTFLDKVEIVSPPTEAEIEAGWEHDWSGSHPDAIRRFYRDEPGKTIIVSNN